MSHSIFWKWRCSVFGKAFQYHLKSLSTAGRDLVEGTDFGLLERVFRQIVEIPSAVQDVLPIANHSEVAELREYPVALFKWIFATSQAGHE